MHDAHHEPPDTSRGFEQSDLSISGIVKGVVLYFIFTGAVGVAVLVYMWIVGVAGAPNQNESAVRRVPPPQYPMLQNNVTARTDIWNLRAREDLLLHNKSWVDQKVGVVRVPIDQAIDMAAEKGPGVLTTLPAGPNPLAPSGDAVPPRVMAPTGNPGAVTPPNSVAGSTVRPSIMKGGNNGVPRP